LIGRGVRKDGMGRLATVPAAVCDIPKSGILMGGVFKVVSHKHARGGGGVLGFWVTQDWRVDLVFGKERSDDWSD
jgi:hypothetical protein